MGLCASDSGNSNNVQNSSSLVPSKNPQMQNNSSAAPVIVIVSERIPSANKIPAGSRPPRAPLTRQESTMKAEQAKAELQKKQEEANKNVDNKAVRDIKNAMKEKEKSSRLLSKQQLKVEGSSRRLEEFAPREPEDEEVELEYDATTQKFVVKKNGKITTEDESAKYIPGNQQGDSELIWDATKKKYVVKGGKGEATKPTQNKPQSSGIEIQIEEDDEADDGKVSKEADKAEVVKAKAIHHGVICVSCAKSPELLILSLLVGALSTEHKCIQGVRYLSSTIKDFNLCEACEKIGHLISAGPFFKINDPDKAPVDCNVVFAEILNPELRPAQGFSIHAGVSCDGCKISDKLCLISSMCGRNIEGTIIGTRFKSAVVNDFDLCEICESSEIFDEKCGPFLKIEVPCVVPLIMTSYEDGSIALVQ